MCFSTNLILRIGFEPADSRVIDLKIKQAQERGAKLINLCSGENDLGFLKQIAKAVVATGKADKLEGIDEFKASLEGVEVSVEAQAIADEYMKANNLQIA